MSRKWMAYFVVSLLCVGALSSVASAQDEATLRFGLSSDPPTLSPLVSGGVASRTVKLTVYEGLIGYTPEGDIELRLAESVEVQDPTAYVFHLRPGVVFHNGEKLTSADVAYTFRMIQDPNSGSLLQSMLAVIASIETPDELTVVFHLTIPFAPFMEVLAQPEASILCESWMSSNPDLNQVMNGTGPFKFEKRIPGVEIAVVKNPDYYEPGVPKVDRIRFLVYADPDARLSALQTGQLDIIEYVEWRQAATIQADPSLVLDAKPSLFQILSVNTSAGPLSDARVRQAISYAINRDEIVAACFEGYAEPLYGALIPPESWAYNADLANYFTYNPNKAKQLLADAGYADGFDCTILATSAYSTHSCPAEVIQAQLALVGINAKVNLVDWPTRVEARTSWNYELASDGLGGSYLDPDFYYQYFHGAGPRYCRPPYFDDPVVNALLDQGRAALGRDERKQIYHDLEKRLLDLSPWIFLCRREQMYAYRTDVRGFQQLPSFLTQFSGVTLKNVSLGE